MEREVSFAAMDKRRLSTIFLIVFVDILGFSLILPLVPYYTERYGASDFVTGLLVASYAAAQLIGAPLLGRLSDQHGRRPILLVSIGGTVLSFVLFGLAEPVGTWLAGGLLRDAALANALIVGVLFISRILDGLTGGNISVAQAYITDVTDAQNRARGLGLVGVAFGLGFILGPAAGGLLSGLGLYVPAFAGAAVAAINWLMVLFLLPESLLVGERRKARLDEILRERRTFSLTALREALIRPLVGTLLYATFFFGLAFAMLQTVFSLYALRRFDLGEQQTAFILTYVGLLSVIVQGGLIGPLTKRFSELTLILVSIGVMALGLLGWAFAPGVAVLLIVLVPIAAAGGVMNVTLRSTITKSVTKQEYGGILGLQSSFESLTRVIAPTLGGLLIGWLGPWSPGVFGALLLGALLPFVWVRLTKERPLLQALHEATPAEASAGD